MWWTTFCVDRKREGWSLVSAVDDFFLVDATAMSVMLMKRVLYWLGARNGGNW